MTNINLSELTIKKFHDYLESGELSGREILTFYLENIKQHDGEIHAFLNVFEDAYEQADAVDKKLKGGQKLPLLAGVPLAIKDNILIKGKKCTAGSKILGNYNAAYDATVITKLKEQGAVFLGKTNMDEFAMGSSTEHSAFGPTKNPYDTERVPGGSSGGSAAAVAEQECFAALGSDTGGSIRQPASFCGAVGLKPTYGSVSRYGLIAMASSLDQIGPFAKCVEDAEIIFNAIKGRDPLDSTTVESKITNSKLQIPKIIGVPKEFFLLEGENKGIDEGVVLNVRKAIDVYKRLGFEIKQVSIESLKYAIAVYYIIMPAEVSSNLARFDGVRYGFSKKTDSLLEDYMATRREGFGLEPRRRILLGTYVLSAGYYDAYYNQALKVRDLMKKDFQRVFKEVDAILSPTTPTPAFKLGEKTEDPVSMYLADIFTVAANLTGVPAISLPAGMVHCEGNNLPVGLQLMAPWFEEEKLFQLGKLFETNYVA